jgi:hypothetical protein
MLIESVIQYEQLDYGIIDKVRIMQERKKCGKNANPK